MSLFWAWDITFLLKRDQFSETTDEAAVVNENSVEEPKMKACEGTTEEAKAPCDTTEPTAIDEPLSSAVTPQQPQNNKNGKANNKKGKKNAKVKIDSPSSDDAVEVDAWKVVFHFKRFKVFFIFPIFFRTRHWIFFEI